MNRSLEIRNITTEIRSLEGESRKITGLAIPVGSRSELLYDKYTSSEFYETIDPLALNDVIERFDVKLYLNHDMSQGTYARSKFGVGSLHLFVTDRGLEFETELPNTAQGDMLLEGIRRGDFDAISFAFKPDNEQWEANNDGTYNRTIHSFTLIDEISVLSCTPAYSVTEVSCRSLENFKEEQRKAKEDKDKEILDNLNKLSDELDELQKEYKV